MKVFNLTDIETETLAARGLAGQQIAVGGRIVNPGEFVEVEDTAKVRTDLEYLLQVGAVSIGSPPPPYLAQRRMDAASAGNAGSHVELNETQTAGEPAPNPQSAEEGVTAELTKADPTAAPADAPPPQEAKPKNRGNR